MSRKNWQHIHQNNLHGLKRNFGFRIFEVSFPFNAEKIKHFGSGCRQNSQSPGQDNKKHRCTWMHSTQIPRCRKQGPWMCPNTPPSCNPGGIFCHYWLLCERGMQECSIRCPEASAGRASKRCVLLAITAHWVTGQWKMSDKHHSENRVPPPLPLPLWQYKWFKNSTRDGAAYFKWHHESQKVKWNIQG